MLRQVQLECSSSHKVGYVSGGATDKRVTANVCQPLFLNKEVEMVPNMLAYNERNVLWLLVFARYQ